MKRYALPVLLSVVFALSHPFCATLRADEEEETPLGEKMEAVADAYKSLRKGLKDPQKEDLGQYKEWAAEIIKASQAAKDMEPALIAKLEGKEKEKMLADYRKDIGAFIEKAQLLQKQLAKGDLEGASKTAKGLNDLKKDGHGKYQEEDE